MAADIAPFGQWSLKLSRYNDPTTGPDQVEILLDTHDGWLSPAKAQELLCSLATQRLEV